MSRFRPCIDLHEGVVKQIVGGSLQDGPEKPIENHVAHDPPEVFARRYAADQLIGGHIIKLGPGNDEAARAALSGFPGGMQLGGGITLDNAAEWIDAGASHVIVTSWLFDSEGNFLTHRAQQLVQAIGRERIVIDLSCRKTETGWRVAMNRWQTLTRIAVNHETLSRLADYANEFLIHAADIEGLCQGIDEDLVELMGNWGGLPITYAGGIASMNDIERIAEVGSGKVDFTVGSALDIFGGTGVQYADLIRWNAHLQHNNK